MAFKRSAVRSRLSPPKTRTHVAERYMGSCSILTENKSGYLIRIESAEKGLPRRVMSRGNVKNNAQNSLQALAE